MPANPKACQTKERARRHFEKWALSYDRSRLNELVFYPCIRACQEEILRWRRQFSRDTYRVLDVGCGTGTLLCMLSRDSAAERLIGLDYSTAMAERAARKFAQHDAVHRLEAVEGDAEHLPFEDESFDIVTCCNSFHHYPHQDQALANFRRVLRPGGLLLLLDGFRDNVIGWLIFDVAVAWVEKHVHHVSWSDMRRLIEGAGFRDLQQRKMNVLAPVLVNRALR